MNLTDLIYFQAKLYPKRPALATMEQIITYEVLVNSIDAACDRIRSLGFSTGDLIGLDMRSSAPHAILILALARLEIPSVSARFDHVTERAGINPTAILALPPAPVQFRWRQILVDESWFSPREAAAKSAISSPASGDPDAVTRIVLSSGTTGVPRASVLTPSITAGRAMRWAIAAPNGSPESRYASGLSFDAAVTPELLKILWQGGLLCLNRRTENFLKLTEYFHLTEMLLSPDQLSKLIEAQRHFNANLQSLQRIRVVGARMPPALTEQARAVICRNILHYYGSTETGVVAIVPPEWERSVEGEAGFVVPWKRVEIVDEADQVLGCGKEGKIRISGADNVDRYYVERPENKDVLRDGWFYPGDVGLLREDGMLVVTGRVTEIINRGGVRIAPAEIEGVLSLHPAVADSGVVGVANAQGLEQVWVAIVARGQVSEAELLKYCRTKLKPGKVPDRFVFVDAIPRNERGKPAMDQLRRLVKDKP